MRVGYVGTLDRSGTCHSRLVALQGAETDVFTLDIDEVLDLKALSKVGRWLEVIPFGWLRTRKLNEMVRKFVVDNKIDVLWIDKGSWVHPKTLRFIRDEKVFMIHHLTDALWPRKIRLRISRFPLLATLKHYDLYFTSNRADWRRLRRLHGERVQLTQLGFDENRFTDAPVIDPEIIKQWRGNIIFIGHWEPRTERGIVALVNAGLPVRVYGTGWMGRERYLPSLRGRVFGPVGAREYVWALNLAKIGLGFVSEWNYNQIAGRSFEIPACGTFLLGMRTREHQEAFIEGEEAEFFEGHAELIEKARYYLANDEHRAQIGRKGRLRCLSSGYSWKAIMVRDWHLVRTIVAQRRNGDGKDKVFA